MTDADNDWAAADAAWLDGTPHWSLERPLYRMPVGFGRAASQRNHPLGKAEFVTPGKAPTYQVTAITEHEALSRILPPGVEVRGEPRLEVIVNHVQEAYWLAGRDYHTLMVRVPVTVTRGADPVDGHYYAVKWDSLPDLMMTARDDIGWPSLWADVSAPIRRAHDAYSFHASWLGYRFFDMDIDDLDEPHSMPRDDSVVQVTYKYIPVGYEPGPDTSKLIVNDLSTYWKKSASVQEADNARGENLTTAREGRGSFTFHHARWEDMPMQFHIVNTLADLPILGASTSVVNEAPYM